MADLSAVPGVPWQPTNAAVLGPGAVGGFLAAILWRHGIETICVAREQTAELLAHEGLRLESVLFGDFVAHPRVVTTLDYPPDLLFVTTKAVSLQTALERIPRSLVQNTIVIPLLNGIEHIQLLRSRLGARVAPGIISIESKYLAPNHIQHCSPYACIQVASDRDVEMSELRAIAQFLSNAGCETEALQNEAEVLWGKLVRLNALACTTTASDRPIGEIRTDPGWRAWLEACVVEGVAVARAHGVDITATAVLQFIDRLPATLGTSMQRDFATGRQPELDAIAGAVIRAGQRKGLACPNIETLTRQIERSFAKRHEVG